MHKVLAMIWVLLFASTAVAQTATEEKLLHTQAPCATYAEMVQLASKHGELPLFIGKGLTFESGTGVPRKGGMVFTVNQDEGSWTMFQVFEDGITCMIFNGSSFSPWYDRS